MTSACACLGLCALLFVCVGGRAQRFINHSCNPNLQVEKWYVNRVPRLGLWAKRDIAAGEELCYNYSVKWDGDAMHAQTCYCGSEQCTGYLGRPPKSRG